MKPIPNFGGYLATEDGRIVSVREGQPKELKQRCYDGYMQVTLHATVNGRRARRRYPVHRLVLLAHQGVPGDRGNVCRHLDGNSLNNSSNNLAWGTNADNALDAVKHGTLGPGERARRRKLTERQVCELLERYANGEPSKQLAEEFGVHRYYPSQLARGKCWSYLERSPGGARKVQDLPG